MFYLVSLPINFRFFLITSTVLDMDSEWSKKYGLPGSMKSVTIHKDVRLHSYYYYDLLSVAE